MAAPAITFADLSDVLLAAVVVELGVTVANTKKANGTVKDRSDLWAAFGDHYREPVRVRNRSQHRQGRRERRRPVEHADQGRGYLTRAPEQINRNTPSVTVPRNVERTPMEYCFDKNRDIVNGFDRHGKEMTFSGIPPALDVVAVAKRIREHFPVSQDHGRRRGINKQPSTMDLSRASLSRSRTGTLVLYKRRRPDTGAATPYNLSPFPFSPIAQTTNIFPKCG